MFQNITDRFLYFSPRSVINFVNYKCGYLV